MVMSLREYTNEELESLDEVKSSSKDLPAILVMRRKSIRLFPNGQKVALYYVDKLKKYVSIPYDEQSTGLNISVHENIEPELDSILYQLRDISESDNSQRIKFDDGSSMVIDRLVANDVLRVYDSLNESNKEKISNKIQQSKYQFKEVVEFAKNRG